jgi:hypothetical protein
MGTNVLLGLAPSRIYDVPELLSGARGRAAEIPPLWDGRAAERIADALGGLPGHPLASPASAILT